MGFPQCEQKRAPGSSAQPQVHRISVTPSPSGWGSGGGDSSFRGKPLELEDPARFGREQVRVETLAPHHLEGEAAEVPDATLPLAGELPELHVCTDASGLERPVLPGRRAA